MTTQLRNWNDILKPDGAWRDQYALIAREAMAYLDTLPMGQTISTNELVSVLLGGNPVVVSDAAKSKMYRALRALSRHELSSHCTPMNLIVRYGKLARPMRWHRCAPGRSSQAVVYSLRSPEHAIVARAARLDPLDPSFEDAARSLAADATKLVGSA